ncbi:MAG: hypothetical protein RQM92_02085 [Candidatus Syntrophopropionicum ammoniitolerans]
MHFRYELDDRPGWGELLLFGLQWLAVTIPPIIVIGRVVAGMQGNNVDPISYLQGLFVVIAAVLLVQVLWGRPVAFGGGTGYGAFNWYYFHL